MNRRELLTGAAAVAVAAAVPELPVEPQVEWFMLPRLAPAAVTVHPMVEAITINIPLE